MKSLNDICFIIQTRLDSNRTPRKSLKSFANSNLFTILLEKVVKSEFIPNENVYVSVYEQELLDIANEYDVNIYKRSYESANEHGSCSPKLLYEWYNRFPYKYCILFNVCNPLIKIETMEKFIKQYLNTKSEGLFTVFEKKTFYWDENQKPITDWEGKRIMHSNTVEPVYEAAHAMYASRMDIIGDDYWMDTNVPGKPELFIMEELEAFDIDYPWQFEVGEVLYKKFKRKE
tara:strand:+ start:1483 stop:2175 length:693 start_codon:yes stop_codon:yes gene_type:complete